MAVVRARSTPPYGAFVGFFLFGVATIGAVGSYFMYAKANEELESAQKSAQSSQQAAAKAKGDLEALDAKLAELTQNLNNAKSDLNKEKAASAQHMANAKLSGDTASADSKALAAAREAFARDLSKAMEDRTKLEAQVAQLNKDRDAATVAGQTGLQKAIEEMEDKNRERVLQMEQMASDIAKKDREIAELRARLQMASGRSGNPTVGEADGTVARVNQGTGEAYIMLGKKDRIVPGMTFTAYDPRTGVRFGTDEAALGNGSLEVIEVGETTSLCRITRTTPNRAIQANDLISNVVYHNDKNRLFRFVVRGNFDLDGDGAATAAERDRIIRLIVSWGGKVDDSVTSQTDYVVTGEKPQSVASVVLADDGEAKSVEPEPGSVAAERIKEIESYDDVILQARRLSIPVLNANRFLAMVGYYNTTIVRYGASK
jgi:hypothetical protein